MKRYTPAAIDLLVAACDRGDQRKRLAELYDARAVTFEAEEFARYADKLDQD